MRAIILALSLFLPIHAFLQEVLDWSSSSSLYNYLLAKSHRQYNERRTSFEKAVASRSNAVQYIKDLHHKSVQLIGEMPGYSPLNATVTGTMNFQDYRVEKVVYESFNGHHVTSNVYVPTGKGPFPAVLFFCGHEDAAKATESYQRTAMLFAKNGFLVLVIDPISQGERLQLFDAKENALARVGKREHTLLNELASLVGTSTPAYQAWDNKRGLDYLVTRADVDSSRIGCIGNSGGGMQAIYFSALENRIKVTAVCSYLSSRERMYDLEGPTDGCVELPNEGRARLEMSDYLMAAAPKPLLVLTGTFDSIDFIGTEAACSDLQKMYEVLGKPECFHEFVYDDGHGISAPKREAALQWFRKWFNVNTRLVKETEWPVLSALQLRATNTGQVSTSYSNEISVADRNLFLFHDLEGDRKSFLKSAKTDITLQIRKLLNITSDQYQIDVEELPKVSKAGTVFRKMILRTAGQIPLPLLVTAPSTAAAKIIIWLDERGKKNVADSLLLQKNAIVILADVRGTGETADKAELNEARYSNKEYRNALLSLHVGETLVAQRTKDILRLIEFAGRDSGMEGLPIEVNASGVVSIAALHAGLFSDRIAHVNLYRGLRSFKEMLQHPTGLDWYSYVIPGVLKYYDLPDLVGLIGVGRVSYFD